MTDTEYNIHVPHETAAWTGPTEHDRCRTTCHVPTHPGAGLHGLRPRPTHPIAACVGPCRRGRARGGRTGRAHRRVGRVSSKPQNPNEIHPDVIHPQRVPSGSRRGVWLAWSEGVGAYRSTARVLARYLKLLDSGIARYQIRLEKRLGPRSQLVIHTHVLANARAHTHTHARTHAHSNTQLGSAHGHN